MLVNNYIFYPKFIVINISNLNPFKNVLQIIVTKRVAIFLLIDTRTVTYKI